jgi:phage portal protein BeeE
MIHPMYDSAGTEFLISYRYVVNGQYYIYAERDIVHFRDGLDPDNQRRGLSCLAAELRHICLDNEAATYSAAIVRNMGVPGVVIKPPPPRSPDEPRPVLGKAARDLIKETWREKFAIDKAGEPLVFDTPLEIAPTGFSPKDLAIDILRKIPEERICAAMGIPAVVVGMGSGLSQATAKASHESSEKQAYYGNIIPTQRLVAEELDLQLLCDLGDPDTEFCGFDLRRVRFLQEDWSEAIAAAVAGYQGGVLKRSEARSRVGEKPDKSDERFIEQAEPAPLTRCEHCGGLRSGVHTRSALVGADDALDSAADGEVDS